MFVACKEHGLDLNAAGTLKLAQTLLKVSIQLALEVKDAQGLCADIQNLKTSIKSRVIS